MEEVRDKDAVSRFLESVDQFERILNDSAFIRLERLKMCIRDSVTRSEFVDAPVIDEYSLTLECKVVEMQEVLGEMHVVGAVSYTHLSVASDSDGKSYIVQNGLEAGDVIVTDGAGLVREGMEIKRQEAG